MARYRSKGGKRYSRGGSYRAASRRSSARSGMRGRANRAAVQRIEIVHVMGPGGPVAMFGNSPAGTVGVSQLKKPKKGGF